jgi:hypothetical protein
MPNTDQSYLNQIWGYFTASRSWRTGNIFGKRLEYALVQGAESKVSYNLTQFHFGTRYAFISVNPPHSPTGTETHAGNWISAEIAGWRCSAGSITDGEYLCNPSRG